LFIFDVAALCCRHAADFAMMPLRQHLRAMRHFARHDALMIFLLIFAAY